MTATYVNWGEAIIKLTWQEAKKLPVFKLITSVHGYCFYKGKLLLVNLNYRGRDIPGGHLESVESPGKCLKREAMEEGYVEGDSKLMGHVIVDHSENLLWNESSPYPWLGYQVYYRMNVKNMHDFEGKFESKERILIEPKTVTDYFKG
ncbi:NUDIX hydrolase [Bacillus sp. ISL-47]|uniref:NUDIX domain-containing protein n=1 Tax=Bacillus sp. ISL-47 TaxID=2819130 RepID=UPI001BE713D7|nr:NUDIX domain-containing protein [Bacillus sp. ISL-47]MBT2687711.1 NUDIX hydrolase [Bacillus sp. ISL-47]MBT2711119.1 hypothetical protein [Pseudomonas sp. ISL-84]